MTRDPKPFAFQEKGTVPFSCPSWMKEGLMYQIFPDRFARSKDYIPPVMKKAYTLREDWGGEPRTGPGESGFWNDEFFGGNLRGIQEKLPYLSELGVTVIYLNPIFEAFSNHRYDTANYRKIDPLLGEEEDFVSLCAEAKKLGIRVILDGVFNHTGSDSIYFNKYGRFQGKGAYQSLDSPYYSWYDFQHWPDRYSSWWGIDSLPAVNETDPSYMDYILRDQDSVVRHWLRLGASGFRLDVVDELPDLFLDELRKVVKEESPDAVIIGEVWEDASTKVSYGQKRRYFDGRQLDSVMNYPLKDAILAFLTSDRDGVKLGQSIESLWHNYPETVFYGLMNILSTHDTPRILTALLENCTAEEGVLRLFSALHLWAFLPGIPCIYYGDELGLTGGREPHNRTCFDPLKTQPKVLSYYRRLLAFRRSLGCLEPLKFQPFAADGSLYSFTRSGQGRRLITAVYSGPGSYVLDPKLQEEERILDVLSSGEVAFVDFAKGILQMEGTSAVTVFIDQKAPEM